MLSKEDKDSLVIGIGNPLRCDDGVGPFLAGEVEKRNIPGVCVVTSQLLNLELLEDAVGYRKVLIIDAGAVGPGVILKKVDPQMCAPAASSHHLSPEFFGAMARQLYQKDLNLYVCSVGADNFEVGNNFSASVLNLIPGALARIETFLKEKQDA